MTNIPYMITDTTVTAYINGAVKTMASNEPAFDELVDALKENVHDVSLIEELFDKPKYIIRMSKGHVEVTDDEILYKGEPVHSVLTQRMLDLVSDGYDIMPWVNFLDNLMENPSYRSREQLYTFLEKWGAPLTQDGCFIAFKNVRRDFRDIHSGRFDNSPGQVVEMDRAGVDDDPNRTCSAGLHACASSYLSSFYVSGAKTVSVKINPKDVVSIPTDYDFAKMRVSRYEVLAEVTREEVEDIESSTFYDYSDLFDDEDEYSIFTEDNYL